MDIKMTGFVHAKAQVRNVSNLRKLVQWCDEHHVDDGVDVDWGAGYVYVALTGDNAVEAEWIECGEHISPQRRHDLLIEAHTCDRGDESPEPARYDWPAKDRLKSQDERLRTYDAWRYNDLTRPE